MKTRAWWFFPGLAVLGMTGLGLAALGPSSHMGVGLVAAAPARPSTKAVLGHDMVAFVSSDGTYSFLRPRGWTVTQSQNGATIRQNPKDTKSARVDLLLLATGGKLNSGQVIDLLAKGMKDQYPSFSEGARQVLSKEHDITAVIFTYLEGQVLMSGVGVAASSGQAVLWGNIYGSDTGFKNYNAAALLIYMMGSMSQGKSPRAPDLPKLPPKAVSARSVRAPGGQAAGAGASRAQRMGQAAVMTHYWNNFRYMHPSAFRWYAR